MTVDELAQRIEDGDVRAVAGALREDPSLATAQTADGNTPLHIACWQKQIAVAGIILAYHPDLNARGCYGRTPLHYAVHEGRFVSVPLVAILTALGADPAIREDNGYSVEDWARTEMDDGLEEALELLRRASPAGPPR